MTVDPADFDAMMRELAEEEDESAVDSVDVGTAGGSVHVNTTNQSSNQQSKDNRRDTLNSMVSEISTFSAGMGSLTFASTVLATSMQNGPVNNTSTRQSMVSSTHTNNRTTTNRASNLSTVDVNKSQMSVKSVNKSQMSAVSEAISTASEAFDRLASERRMTVDPTDLAILDDTAIDTSATEVDGVSSNVSLGRVSMGTMGETMGEDNGDGSTVFNDTNIYQHLYEPSMSTNHDTSSVFGGASVATDAKTFNTRSVKTTASNGLATAATMSAGPSIAANPSPRSVKTTKTSASSIRPSTVAPTRANIPRSPNSDDVMTNDRGNGTSPASVNSVSSRIIEAQYQRALAGGGQGLGLGSVKTTNKSPSSKKTATANHSVGGSVNTSASSKVVDNDRMSIMSMMTMSTLDMGPPVQHHTTSVSASAATTAASGGVEQEEETVVESSAGNEEAVSTSHDPTVSSRKSVQSTSTTMTRLYHPQTPHLHTPSQHYHYHDHSHTPKHCHYQSHIPLSTHAPITTTPPLTTPPPDALNARASPLRQARPRPQSLPALAILARSRPPPRVNLSHNHCKNHQSHPTHPYPHQHRPTRVLAVCHRPCHPLSHPPPAPPVTLAVWRPVWVQPWAAPLAAPALPASAAQGQGLKPLRHRGR